MRHKNAIPSKKRPGGTIGTVARRRSTNGEPLPDRDPPPVFSPLQNSPGVTTYL
jgi:hypothetical protein